MHPEVAPLARRHGISAALRAAVAWAALAALLLAAAQCGAAQPAALRIGSKRFTESTILGEVLVQAARPYGPAEHIPGMGNTAILVAALRNGAIDLYPEYLGTIELEILHHATTGATLAQLEEELAPQGLGIAIAWGFENRYAIGMRRGTAQQLHLARTSELAAQPQLRAGLSHEFLGRADGWPGLARRYGLRNRAEGLDHGLAFEALAQGQVDLIDVYTTDAKIARYDLQVLADDLGYFPRYDAVVLYRRAAAAEHPAAWRALQALAGRIDTARMIGLNSQAELGHRPAQDIARDFLAPLQQGAARAGFLDRLFGEDFWRLARQHLLLVVASVLTATLAGIPLGILAARSPWAGRVIFAAVGILQTIPALALLAALIPLLGAIGTAPTLVALILFALLPIVRNTAVGLGQVPLALREAATALGARGAARLWYIELPLAAPVMLAGIRTATVISVGTATIGAFVGAGGFGERIAIGLALNDGQTLLAGALPAAALAVGFELAFGAAERLLRRPAPA